MRFSASQQPRLVSGSLSANPLLVSNRTTGDKTIDPYRDCPEAEVRGDGFVWSGHSEEDGNHFPNNKDFGTRVS